MSLGPVMVDLRGTELLPEERELLQHPAVGGVILFARNYESPEQAAALTHELHKLREPRLLIAVDQEGGRVQRFQEGFTRLPPVARLGEIYDHDHRRAKRLAELTGWLMAMELRAVGVDFSFAPVLDLGLGVSQVIGDRAFHRKPHAVADLAHSYMGGMQRAGMAAVGKHFPGHGSVAPDSHLALPVDPRPYADLEAEDLVPFERMIHFGLPAVMTAHVVYSACDGKPASFSPFWINEVLRKQLRFQGVVFSDDLGMEGAAIIGDFPERAQAALAAGSDMVLVCNRPEEAVKVAGVLTGYDDPVSHVRLARLHGRHPLTRSDLLQRSDWKQAARAVESYASSLDLDLDL